MLALKGFLNINKPKDLSSHDVVYRIRKRLRELNVSNVKVGHTGTLDPFAEGVLLISLGKATKLTSILQNKTKTYIANVQLGIQTDSDDITGKIIEKQKVVGISKELIFDTFKKYQGKIVQEPPIFSAIRVNGKRLYEYARNKVKINIPKREVIVNKLELLEYFKNESIKLLVECSAGTYIRSLARDISRDMGTFGVLKELTRISVDNFCIEDSLKLDDVLHFEIEDFVDNLIRIQDIFDDIEEIFVDDENISALKNAQLNFLESLNLEDDKTFILKYNDEVLGLVKNHSDLGRFKFVVNLM